MAVEDAIAEMDMLGHSFFVFINAETGITSVIYRRADGKIGMIEPIQGYNLKSIIWGGAFKGRSAPSCVKDMTNIPVACDICKFCIPNW